MFYVNLNKYDIVIQPAIEAALLIPPDERDDRDHMLVYRYFTHN